MDLSMMFCRSSDPCSKWETKIETSAQNQSEAIATSSKAPNLQITIEQRNISIKEDDRLDMRCFASPGLACGVALRHFHYCCDGLEREVYHIQ